MEFEEVLEQTIVLLQRQGRVSYGALKRRFQLDDAYLEDLKVELIEAQQLAHDENGRILVWSGGPVPTSPLTPELASQSSHISQQSPTQEAQTPPLEPAYTPQRAPEAERRQLTVMFCDLVDSTALAVRLDPEDLREVVLAYQETSAAMIQRFGGYIAQYLGDGLLVYFGYPLQVYRILGESAAQSRLEVAEASGFTPLVGRESEVVLLLERWAQSKDGKGQVVLLRGEAGIGKSRLVETLSEHVRREGATRIAFRCSPYYQNSALYPVIDHLQRFLQWQRDDNPEAKLDMLERVLRTYRLPLEDVVPLFAALLSVPLLERYPALNLTPQLQRQKTQEALVAWLLEEADRQPVLAVWEDLYWADPSTLEWLNFVLDQASTARMLTLLTCRPEFRPPWEPQAPVTQVILNRLGHAQVETMMAHLTGAKALPAEVVQQVVVKTDGIPLFVEELVKMILESGLVREEADRYVLTGPLPPLAIPSTLHDSLMARLDRLSAARDLAQLGAVLGREFAYELLQAISPLDETTLQQGLVQLVDAELVCQRGLPPRSRYVFKHALIQDAAYQSLLRSTRQRYHQRTAQVLEAQFRETIETQPELVAHHYTEASLPAQAVLYWQRAGQRAGEGSAYVEAISHLTKGLEVLQALPDTPARAQQELDLQIALGQAFIVTKGQAAPEVGHTYSQARELCRRVEDVPQLCRVLWGLYSFHVVRAELQTARKLSEELLTLAQHLQDPLYLQGAHFALGSSLLYLGEFPLSREQWEQSLAFYNPQQHYTHAVLMGWDLGVFGRAHAPHTLWSLGYPDQALTMSREALTLAQELSHPFSLAVALDYAAMLHQFRLEPQAVRERADAAIALCTEHGFAYYLAWGTTMQGWVQVAQGQAVEGLVQMRHGLAALRATGASLRLPYYLALLAEACGRTGQAAEGLTLLAEALAQAHNTGESWMEAELHRLKGELLLSLSADHHVEAEACLYQALDIARCQQAKSLELRAATSLRWSKAKGDCASGRSWTPSLNRI
jgi:predicted ATPase